MSCITTRIHLEQQHIVKQVDSELEKALFEMCDIGIQTNMSAIENLEGFKKVEIDQSELQKRQQEEDRPKELEPVSINAKLGANDLDTDTEEARKIKANLDNYLGAIASQQKGLFAIRKKDIVNHIDSLHKLVVDLDNDQLIHNLRVRYSGHTEATKLADDLKKLHERAINMIGKFEEILKMRREIEKLDRKTFAEIRSMSTPPPIVRDVMMATFILLGEEPKFLKWDKVRALLGKTGKNNARRRILELDLSSLDGKYKTIKRAKVLCKDQTLDQIKDVSMSAAVFTSWCLVTIDTLETTW